MIRDNSSGFRCKLGGIKQHRVGIGASNVDSNQQAFFRHGKVSELELIMGRLNIAIRSAGLQPPHLVYIAKSQKGNYSNGMAQPKWYWIATCRIATCLPAARTTQWFVAPVAQDNRRSKRRKGWPQQKPPAHNMSNFVEIRGAATCIGVPRQRSVSTFCLSRNYYPFQKVLLSNQNIMIYSI